MALLLLTIGHAGFSSVPKNYEAAQHSHAAEEMAHSQKPHAADKPVVKAASADRPAVKSGRRGRDYEDIMADLAESAHAQAADESIELRSSAAAMPNFISGIAPTYPGQSWGLLSITSVFIHDSYDQDWLPQGDADPYLWVKIGGNRYESMHREGDNRPTYSLHLHSPPSGSATVEVWDDDTLTGDDLIFSVSVDLSRAGAFTQRVTQQECSTNTCWRRFWWGSVPYPCRQCSTVITGWVSGEVVRGPAAVAAEVSRLSVGGVELTEAWTPLLDGASPSSYWQSAMYYVSGLGYLIRGNIGDDAGNPGSGIIKTVLGRANACFSGHACTAGMKQGPGPDTTSIVSHSLALQALTSFCDGLARLDRFRRNELGIQFFNGRIWPEKPSHSIGLGDSFTDHAVARPLLDKMVGPAFAMSRETRRAISEAATQFWRRSSPDTADVGAWNIVLLHKFHLGLDVSLSFASEFVAKQLGYLAVASAPDNVACAPGVLVGSVDCDELLAYKAARIAQYKPALAAKFPAEWAALDELGRTKLASQVLDSLLFAGGISIPTVVRFAFAVLYGEYGRSQLGPAFELSQPLVMRFVLEVVRRFPPVAGFASWDRATNHHTIIDLFAAQLDTTSGWGETAQDFIIRPLSEYHAKHIGWANQAVQRDANGDELNGHPNSRSCPAKDLSLIMVSEFLGAFLREGGTGCFVADKLPSDITVNGYSATTIRLAPSLQCEAGKRDAELSAQQLLGFGAADSLPFTQRLYEGVTADSRFDLYTRAFTLALRQNYEAPPQTALAVTAPVEQAAVPEVVCGLAGMLVPAEDEHQADLDRLNRVISLANTALDFPETADECGVWRPGENPEAVIREMLGVWPSSRVLNPLGPDRYSDSALEEAVFRGIGQHRITRAARGDSRVASLATSPSYVVDLSFAETLETRSGFARLGAAAFFDDSRRVVAIHRLGKLYTPDGPQGTSRQCDEYWSWGAWYPRCSDQWQDGWLHAKMAFRGTLVAIITVIDHLHGVHLTAGNALATANVEELPPSHALRRLLTPFAFRTEAINYNAAVILTPELTLVHRAMGLSKQGIVRAFEHGNTSSANLQFNTIPQLKAGRDVPELGLALDEDGEGYYEILLRLLTRYLANYYPPVEDGDGCAADEGIGRWYARVRSILPHRDLPPLTCANLADVLATLLYHVTASHRHTGTIAAETSDPCWAPSAWIDGYLCGLPRTSFTQSFIMATTGLEQPKLIEDYSHVFADSFGRGWWASLRAEMMAYERVVEDRNTRRDPPFAIFLPSKIETAVGI